MSSTSTSNPVSGSTSATSINANAKINAGSSKLFEPLQLGNVTLSHRVTLAPLTRFRANKAHVHSDLAVEYYSQRGRSIPGTLLITEATYIAARGGGADYVPGVWSDAQVEAWKKVADAVHKDGSYIFMQIWALGRAGYPNVLAAEDPNLPYVSSSDVPLSNRPATDPAPRPLTIAEIKEYVQLFGEAAYNAVHRAGFDGVEIHGAHGYLVDQFLQDLCNKRVDEYGGSVENRSRFALEVVDEVVKRVGAERVGIRISPWSTFQGMFHVSRVASHI
jgi:NADPH2 dehydrogenase